MQTESSTLQPLKALVSIDTTAGGKIACSSRTHPWNAPEPTTVTLAGIVTAVRQTQSLKASTGMADVVAGITMVGAQPNG
jgi:hypothetical protein